MSIWNITNIKMSGSEMTCEREALLWRLDAGSFIVIEQGAYLPVLSGPEYSLVDKKYAPVFELLKEQVSVRPVIIFDKKRGTENADYIALEIDKEITPETIQLEDSSGSKVWVFKGSVFVSDEVKDALEKIPVCEFYFFEGFQMWG